MKARIIQSLAAFLFFSIVPALAGCQSTPPSPPASPPAQPTAASVAPVPTTQSAAATAAPTSAPAAAPTAVPETVKLGIAASLTGRVARISLNSDRFARMAMDDVNAQGGVKVAGKTYRFDAVTADDKFTSEGGREAANRLVLADKVKFISGTLTTPSAGIQTVSEPNKVLFLPTSTVDRSLGPNYPLTFQTGAPHQRMRSIALYDWLVKNQPQSKRIAVLTLDDASGQGYTAVAEEYATARGLAVVSKELVSGETKDFGPVITRILRNNPDAIDIANMGAFPASFLSIAQALYEQGFRKTFFGIAVDLGAFKSGAPGTSQYVVSTATDLTSNAIGAKERDLYQRAIKAYGESELEPSVVGSYNAPMLLAQAMEKAGTVSDTESIAKVLAAGEWETIAGKARFGGVKTFGAPVMLDQPVYLSKAEGAKLVTFEALKVAMP